MLNYSIIQDILNSLRKVSVDVTNQAFTNKFCSMWNTIFCNNATIIKKFCMINNYLAPCKHLVKKRGTVIIHFSNSISVIIFKTATTVFSRHHHEQPPPSTGMFSHQTDLKDI